MTKHMTRTALAALIAAAVVAPAQAQWVQVPLRTAAAKANGQYGGEGAQVVTNIASDSTGNFLVFGTDVGGLYRSFNGGDRWEPINVGYKPRGSAYVTIDPANNQVVLSVGANGGDRRPWHGIWRSADQGSTWSNVLPKDNDLDSGPGGRGARSLVFDPSSVSNGATQTVYWSTPNNIASGDQGLWKSTDNGQHWTHLTTSYAGCYLAVHPTNGTLYVGAPDGLYRSTTGGTSFTKVLDGQVFGLATSKAQPNWVYAVRSYDIELSTDSGDHWAKKGGGGLPTSAWNGGPGWFRLEASPADATFLSIAHDTGYWADHPRYYTHDGGDNWFVPSFDKTNAFLGLNTGRTPATCFSPVSATTLWDTAGDQIYKSVNGGSNLFYENNGYGAFTCSAIYNFNPFNPNIVLVTSQDYESAVTTDGGDTWQYLDPHTTNNNSDNTPGWGGYQYGGYAFDANTMFAGDAQYWNGDCTIRRTTDGGRTYNDWTTPPNADDSNNPAVNNSYKVATPDPTDPNRAFYGHFYTTDKGATWHGSVYISGSAWCDGVFTYNADPNGDHALYGASGNTVIKSTDHGASWQYVHQFAHSSIRDIAYDWKNNRLYVADDIRQLRMWDGSTEYDLTGGLPADNDGQYGRVATVCVDPVDPNILYIGNHADLYATNLAVAKGVYNPSSGAYTWTNLTKQPGGSGLDGGHEPTCVRVNPGTRELWAFGECYGVWKYPGPGGGSSEAAYNGPHAIPGTLQAEDYDTGGQGVAYSDTDSANNGGAYRNDGVDIEGCSDTGGGYDVGWTNAGEYLKYTVSVTTAGSYTAAFRVASPSGGTFHLEDSSGKNLTGAITAPSTGGWQTWQTVTSPVFTLPAGTQILKLVEDSAGYNLNAITFASQSAPTGVNVAQGKSASASSIWDGNYDASKAVDGNTGTGWSASGTDTGAWVQIDLGQAYTLSQIQVVTRQDVDQPETRRGFEVWASNNADMGQGHVVLGTQGSTSLAYQATWSQAVTDTTAYRYLAFVKTDGAYAFVSELRAVSSDPSALTAN